MNELLQKAFRGAQIADALAMPVHWYYDRAALRRDYGVVDRYLSPRNPHPDSILWRSNYEALNERGDILRKQVKYWGQRNIHYHQFLKAGENTLNFRLAAELFQLVSVAGHYSPDTWLALYIDRMLDPHWNRDTYAEEYHRAFFTHYAEGRAPEKCGIVDEHIGGLSTVPALVAALGPSLPLDEIRQTVRRHVALTHAHDGVLQAADTLVRLLFALQQGVPLRDALAKEARDWLSISEAKSLAEKDDEQVIGVRFSSACYIAEAMPAALYLAWKYHDDFKAGIVANSMLGGDSCHRGAVVGSLLGAASEELWIPPGGVVPSGHIT